MHPRNCSCGRCAAGAGRPRAATGGPIRRAAPLGEANELALALELLEANDEADLERFLGKVFRTVGKAASRLAKGPLGRALKSLAKAALPAVGGALGSFIPIPGVGTALGTALGSAASKALEAELAGVEREMARLEAAQRMVRIAADAARAVDDPSDAAAARTAVVRAACRHVPGLRSRPAPPERGRGR